MCGGSQKQKTSSTSTYTPTTQATGLYNNVIGQATTAAATPYNPATQQQVAGFTPDQLAAFGMVNGTQGNWTPYTDRAGQLFEQSAAPISTAQIQNYMDPYQQMVIDAAQAQQQRSDAQAMSMAKGNAIAGGALGGNAVGVNQAVLAGEQGRNRNSMLANLLSGGYSQALNAAQSDAARQAAIGGQFGQLGQMVQGLSLNDIQARLAAGNQQQQQTQTELDAASSNAAAQTMWPYQNAQWLASIGAGIGPLTGGTTTGTSTTKASQGKGFGQIVGAGLSAASMLSDRRAKEDQRVIGKTFDGQNVYSFRYKGSPKTQIGLMADEVREHHPEAVRRGPGGLDMVDYDQATPYANGGAVQGNAFGGRGASYFPWAPIAPAQMVMPQLPQDSVSGGGGQSDPLANPEQAIKLGKSARSGLDSLFKSLDPAKGWGASIEPTAGGGGGWLSSLGSLFGFRDGGEVQDPYSPTTLVDQFAEGEDRRPRRGTIPVDVDRANMLMELLADTPVIPRGSSVSTADMMKGFADGGGVNFAFLSPDVMSPWDLRPDRVPPLKDEFIGEIGPSDPMAPQAFGSPDVPMANATADIAASNERQMRSFEEAERAASNARMMRSFEEAERAGRPPWYRQSLTDMLGITEGRTDPNASLTFPKLPTSAPSNGGPDIRLDNGAVRFGGRTVADMLAGRPGVQPAVDSGDIDAGSTPYLPGVENNTPMSTGFGTSLESPYEDAGPGMSVTPTTEAIELPDGMVTPGKDQSRLPAGGASRAVTPSGPFDTAAFIKQQEGYRPNAYADGRQTSIGYGTRARFAGETIDREEAERRLRSEIGSVEKWLDRNITTEMTPQQRGALVSFGFNLGVDDLDKLKKDINAGDWGKVAGRMRTFNKEMKNGKLVVNDGLTNRRLREAALVSGGQALPEPGALPPEAETLVTKGMSGGKTDTAYASPRDKQTGGLLKRLFGVDFNPLKLDEDERQALLVAGLSMMSSGDIGAGGLAGVKFLQGRQAADREAAMAATKLGLEMFKTGHAMDIDQQRLDLERTGKPTDDARNYQLARDEGFGGTFMDFMREKRMLEKGGAEIPAEVAARIGLGRAFMRDLPSIEKEISQFTAGDRADLAIGRGRALDVWTRVESGREALVRQLTGAGMSQSEAENQTKRYQISSTDKTDTMLRKVRHLERDLRAVEEGALAGKTGTMSRQFQSGSSTIPASSIPRGARARNPQTGQIIQFDGSAWQEVRP